MEAEPQTALAGRAVQGLCLELSGATSPWRWVWDFCFKCLQAGQRRAQPVWCQHRNLL